MEITQSLVDGHCHPVIAADLNRQDFELACSEASRAAPVGVSYLDSQVGWATLRWCPPALGLPPHADVEDYLRRRAELGWAQATAALLTRAGFERLLVDTGIGAPATGTASEPPRLTSLTELAAAANAPTGEVIRLEWLAEHLAATGDGTAGDFADRYQRALAERSATAVAVKSILCYRYGLDLPPTRPAQTEVKRAAGDWLRTGGRLTDPALLRFTLWAGADTGLPIQLHTGFGDRDLALRSADPALAQPLLAALEPSGNPVVLLHCYPYHRQAGWLAQTYPNVYVDVGLTLTHLGARADAVLAEFVELAPVGKLLFSTDGYLLPELYLVGAAQFRQGLARLVDTWIADDVLAPRDAERLVTALCSGNARRVYQGASPRTTPTSPRSSYSGIRVPPSARG